jgi:hypothetical protein
MSYMVSNIAITNLRSKFIIFIEIKIVKEIKKSFLICYFCISQTNLTLNGNFGICNYNVPRKRDQF